jgi:hypothetical protein
VLKKYLEDEKVEQKLWKAKQNERDANVNKVD